MNGRLYLRHYYWPVADKKEMSKAGGEGVFYVAIDRNPEDYKNYESLGEVYTLRAKESPDQEE